MRWFEVARTSIARHPFAADTVVAVALAVFVLQDIATSGDYYSASKAIYVPAALLMTLPLAFRRRAPFVVVVVVMGALACESLAVGSAPTPDTQLVAGCSPSTASLRIANSAPPRSEARSASRPG
jgi:hypothetical protein